MNTTTTATRPYFFKPSAWMKPQHNHTLGIRLEQLEAIRKDASFYEREEINCGPYTEAMKALAVIIEDAQERMSQAVARLEFLNDSFKHLSDLIEFHKVGEDFEIAEDDVNNLFFQWEEQVVEAGI